MATRITKTAWIGTKTRTMVTTARITITMTTTTRDITTLDQFRI